MSCHDSSPNFIPVGINYDNATGKATGLAEIRTLDVSEIKPIDGILMISGTQVEIKTSTLILSSDVDVFIPGNLTVSGSIIGETTPVNLDAYITSSTFNPFSATVTSHIGTTDIHFTSGGLVDYTNTIYPSLTNYNTHIASGSVHFTSGSLSGYYAASAWVDANYTDNADFNSHTSSGAVHFTSGSLSASYVLSSTNSTLSSLVTNLQASTASISSITNSHIGSGTVHFTSGSLSGYYAASAWVDANYTDNADFASHTGSGSVHFTSGSLSSFYAASTVVDSRLSGKQNFDATLNAIANIATGPSALIYFSGTDLAATTTLSDFARNILDDSNASTVRSTIGTVIGTDVQAFNTGLKDLADFGDEGSYAAIPFVGTAGNYIRLETGGPASYKKILRLYDPLAPALPGVLAEPRWEFLYLSSLENTSLTATPQNNATLFYSSSLSAWTTTYSNIGQQLPGDSPGLEGLRNVNSSSVQIEVNTAILDGDPFVWDSNVSAWSHRNLTNFAGNIAPELAPYFVSAGGGTYGSSNYRVSSLSATTVSATTYLNLDPTLQALANQSTASNVLVYFSGVDLTASALFTSAGRKFCAVSSTLAAGDVFYYNGTDIVKLARPTYPAVLLIDNFTPTESGMPYWLEAPASTPSQSYVLQVDTDGSNNPGAISWVTK